MPICFSFYYTYLQYSDEFCEPAVSTGMLAVSTGERGSCDMSEIRKLDDRELEKVDGGWISWNPIDEAWEALDDEDYSLLGSFSGSYDDTWARRAAQNCALHAGSTPCEIPFGPVYREREANQ